jgi:hypothetical protein
MMCTPVDEVCIALATVPKQSTVATAFIALSMPRISVRIEHITPAMEYNATDTMLAWLVFWKKSILNPELAEPRRN